MTASNPLPVWHPQREPLRGAYQSLEQLTAAHLNAAELSLPSLLLARGNRGGQHRSRARGRGLEFEEVRTYQAGDDIRNIDWRVTARCGRPFTKLFREERERPLVLLVDQRQPMFFGSRTCFKSALASYLGALIAWTGLQAGDRVGGVVVGNSERGEIRPRHTRATIMAWLRCLHDFNHRLDAHSFLQTSTEDSLVLALTDLRRSLRPGSSVILISDFAGARDPRVREQLHGLARHNVITALQIFDPLEQQLPAPARYTISDGRQRLQLDSGDRNLRQRHQRHFADHCAFLQTLFGNFGARLLPISTDAAPLAALQARLDHRTA